MDHRFDFDPQLPALSLAFDFKAVAQLFEECWSEHTAAARPHVTIPVCRLQDTQYQPSVRCVTTYELVVEQPGATPWRTIGVIEISPTGLAPRLFDHDPQIPCLALATDRDGMRKRFATLRESAAGAESVEVREITPIRYKPGSRCMFRYVLHTPSGQRVFFGKLLAQGDERLMAIITALYQASQDAPGMPRILRPLAYWPEVHMVVQPAVAGGVELNARAFDTSEDGIVRGQWMRDAGAGLAALHAQRSVGVGGPRRVLEDDLCDLQEYSVPIAKITSALATRFKEAIGEIATMARGRAEPAPVASHGAFRTDQFLIEDGCLVLIDLDSFCWANPARDIGNFLAYLSWKAIRQPQHAVFIERAEQAFLDGYMTARPELDEYWLSLYQAASMLKIVGRRFRGLIFNEWSLVPRLLDAALAILSR